MYLNKAFVIGNLTRDPEMKALPSGTKVVSFGLATNRYFRDKEGNRKDETEFHNIVVFAKLAELCAQYLKKGSQVFVEGRITNRTWDKADGTKGYRSEIIAESVQFGARPGGAGAQAAAGKGAGKDDGLPDGQAGKGAPGETIEYPQEDINPDDIPF